MSRINQFATLHDETTLRVCNCTHCQTHQSQCSVRLYTGSGESADTCWGLRYGYCGHTRQCVQHASISEKWGSKAGEPYGIEKWGPEPRSLIGVYAYGRYYRNVPSVYAMEFGH